MTHLAAPRLRLPTSIDWFGEKRLSPIATPRVRCALPLDSHCAQAFHHTSRVASIMWTPSTIHPALCKAWWTPVTRHTLSAKCIFPKGWATGDLPVATFRKKSLLETLPTTTGTISTKMDTSTSLILMVPEVNFTTFHNLHSFQNHFTLGR